ncbi:hypothetical protein AZE42_11615 [Rhizopogon vesiculosus]|uniref:Uncharacterized protein n=1 Tax=Rhizopogon vesiculosus TaxID=180088 RepID=A0A1J8PVL4_9AGAM|nr:hypothetical protein AZE42_11615 [Rhizopogon vesiculosus]
MSRSVEPEAVALSILIVSTSMSGLQAGWRQGFKAIRHLAGCGTYIRL